MIYLRQVRIGLTVNDLGRTVRIVGELHLRGFCHLLNAILGQLRRRYEHLVCFPLAAIILSRVPSRPAHELSQHASVDFAGNLGWLWSLSQCAYC